MRSEGWCQLETKPRPLLLPNHFLQQVLSHIKSFNKALAITLHGKLSKSGSEQGPAFLTVFPLGKREARLRGAITAKRSLLCPPRCSQRKKGCWVLKFLIRAARKTHGLVGEKKVTEHLHLLMFSMSPCSVMMFRSPSISSRALWYLCAQSSLWWNISSRAADCTCRQQPRAKRLLPDQTRLSQHGPSAA